MTSVERLLSFLNVKGEAASATEQDPGEEWPVSGAIEIKGLSLKYRDELPTVLKNVNLVIPGGKKVSERSRAQNIYLFYLSLSLLRFKHEVQILFIELFSAT